MKRKWFLAVFVCVLLLPIVIGGIMVYQQIRQDTLDRALIVAAHKLDAPAVIQLLNQGANANARETSEPPLTLQLLLQHFIARLQHKAVPKLSSEGDPVLLRLITDDRLYYGREDSAVVDTIAVVLIAHGANLRVRGYRQETPLADAAAYKLHRSLRLMLSKGADVNSHDDFGLTPLMGADIESGRLLLQHGADVNAVDANGNSLLYNVMEQPQGGPDKAELMFLLERHGARLNKSDENNLAEEHIPIPPELRRK